MDNDYTQPKMIVSKPKQMLNGLKFKSILFLVIIASLITTIISVLIFMFVHLDWFWVLIIVVVIALGVGALLFFTLFKPDMLGYSRWDKIFYTSVETRDVKVTDIKSTFKIRGKDSISQDERTDLEKTYQFELTKFKEVNDDK